MASRETRSMAVSRMGPFPLLPGGTGLKEEPSDSSKERSGPNPSACPNRTRTERSEPGRE